MKVFRIILVTLFITTTGMVCMPASVSQASPDVSQFGYTRTKPSYTWEEIAAPANLILTNTDNTSVMVDLPTSFNFFEHSYNAIFVSVNGFISFDPLGAVYSLNKPVPLDELPNNLVAPWWDDLTVGGIYNSGNIYFQVVGAAPNMRMIIEWDQVTMRGSTDPLSFQVVLSKDESIGTDAIEFRYKTIGGVTDQSTVGIEDSDGVDGIQVPNNEIQNNTAVRFTYPGHSYRFKILQTFQSGLLGGGSVLLPVTIVNTSSAGLEADRYNIETSQTNWAVSLKSSNGQTLVDTNNDGKPDTGPVLPGNSITIQVQLNAPFPAVLGTYTKVNVTVTSVKNAAKSLTVVRQAAVSAPFVQNFSDNTAGKRLQFVNAKNFLTKTVQAIPDYQYSLVVTPLSDNQYITAWGYGSGTYINIQYSLLSPVMSGTPVVKQLTNNPDYTTDHAIAMARTSNGIIGVAFVRTVSDSGGSDAQKQNVWFARIDANGNKIGAPVNITNNTYVGTPSDPNVPFFSMVNISATQDNHFIIAWAKQEVNEQNNKVYQDVYEALYDSSGNQTSAPHALTASDGIISYFSPSLTRLDTSDQTFLTWISNEPSNPLNPTKLWGVALNNSGAKTGADLQLAEITGSKIDSAQLWNGNLLVAWIDDVTLTPTYGIWTSSGGLVKAKTSLTPPDGRSMSQIAVTYDQYGHGIITWGNTQEDRIYYALVTSDGGLITPPMIQRSATGSDQNINLCSSTYSTAFLEDLIVWKVNIPMVRK